ncbi:MAG: DUF4440 domain-containing protein [Pseudomonadota bacterium]
MENGQTTLDSDDLQQIRQLEEGLWQAEIRFSPKMEEILADDFFEFGRSGRTYSRDQCLEISDQPINAVIPLPDFNARYITRDVVQTTYRSIVTHSSEEQHGLRSSLWLRTQAGWKLKFHQGTAVA